MKGGQVWRIALLVDSAVPQFNLANWKGQATCFVRKNQCFPAKVVFATAVSALWIGRLPDDDGVVAGRGEGELASGSGKVVRALRVEKERGRVFFKTRPLFTFAGVLRAHVIPLRAGSIELLLSNRKPELRNRSWVRSRRRARRRSRSHGRSCDRNR